MPSLAFTVATLVNGTSSEITEAHAIALESAPDLNGPDSNRLGSARRLRKAVGQVEREPERPEETYQPTKTFVA